MPSPTTTKLPIPKSWDEFEDIVADVLKLRWKNPHVTRNGRSGQRQHGVDICGTAAHLPAGEYAVDARLREIGYGRWEGSTLTQMQASDPAIFAARPEGRVRDDHRGQLPEQQLRENHDR